VKEASLLREAQTLALSIPNTGMAVTADIGELDDMHPKNKKDVGERLALWALNKDYGLNEVVFSGPVYRSFRFENQGLRLSFNYVQSGLKIKGKSLVHFEIAGKDRVFYPAHAKIDEQMIIVKSDRVDKPVAVRYAWRINEIPNLYNGVGLPAIPFRSDDWDIAVE